jgi:adenylate cyclase
VRAIQQAIPAIEQEQRELLHRLQPLVRDKLCFVGYTAAGAGDIKPTPIAAAVPGVSINLAAASTLLSGRHLIFGRFWVSAAIMLLVTGRLAGEFLRRPVPFAGAEAAAAIAALILAAFLFLQLRSVIVSPVTPTVGVVVSYAVITTYRWWLEYQQKKLVRTIFEAHTNQTIVQRLIEAGERGVEEVLAPKTRQITVFFAEIADYNDLAEKSDPEQLPRLLSRVFGTLSKILLGHEGTLDRYQGHAMVAFFGAPVYQPDHAERACRAALECRDAVQRLADEPVWRDLPPLRIHFGLHTGELLVGNITLTSRVDYTVAGENLNVAYRVADVNETYGTLIVLTEATFQRCEQTIEVRELDLVRIKGRREPVRVYELLATRGCMPAELASVRGNFVAGLSAFRNRDYAAALAMFRSCRDTVPSDRPSTVYIERCEEMLQGTVSDGPAA